VAKLTDEELKKKLSKEEYHVIREGGTEPPFSGKFLNNNEEGVYTCAVCGAEIFRSKDKFDSTTPGLVGWPSFSDVAKSGAVKLTRDTKLFGMPRTEVTCTNCGSHLGHLFEDSAATNGTHYCINSVSLGFKKK